MSWTIEKAEKVAEKKGWKVNPDKKYAQEIIEGLNKNKEKKGKAFCPCRVVTGDPEEDKKIICPCIYSPMEILQDGKCHCGLYVKK